MRVFVHFAVRLSVAVLLLWATAGPACAKPPPAEPSHVLLLNSYHQTMTWVRNITQAVEDELLRDGSNLMLHVENMDSKRFHSPEYLHSLLQAYRVKYRTTRFDLILASDNNAFDFLRRHGETLFPGIPVVFCGVNYLQEKDLVGHDNFTGVEEIFDAAATLEIALQNHPETRKVFIVNDYLKTGRAWEQSIRQQLASYASRLQLDYADNLSLAELEQQLSSLEQGTIVLLGVYFADREGRFTTYERIGEMLAGSSQVPVYCLLEFNVGRGVVGGNVISGYSQGQAMARMGKQILRGSPPESLPILRTGVNRNIFNYPQLRRFAIDEAGLPAERSIVNRPFSLYREYRTIIWLTSGLIGFLLMTITALIINTRLRKQTERQLKRSEQKFRAVFNHTFEFIGLLDLDGRLLDTNLSSLHYSGVAKDAVVGRYFWETPWWRHSRDEQKRLRDAIDRARKGEIIRYEATQISPDGQLESIDFSLKPVLDEQGQVVLLIPEGRDISERIAMEGALRESEDRLATALEAANEGLWDWQIENDAFYFNPTYYTMLGYRADEFPATYHEFAQRLHPRDRDRVEEEIARHLAGKAPFYQAEFRMRKKDGDWSWILARGKMTERDASGIPLRIIGIHSDISQRKQAERELQSAQRYVRNIFDSMPSVLIGIDPQGVVTQWNKEAEKRSGTETGQAIGQALHNVFPPLAPQLEKVRTALNRREPQTEHNVIFKDTEMTGFFDVTVYPLTANGSEGAVIRIDDITEQVRLEEMILQSDKMLSVGGLAAGMAHEINNPLAGILQSAQVMQRRLDPCSKQNRAAAEACGVNINGLAGYLEQRGLTGMLATILDSGRRAAAIVENMLNFSRKSESNKAPRSLANILDKSLELASSDYDLQSLYDFKNIEITRDYAPDMPVVPCEETKIQQVFLNILKNGAQAMFAKRGGSSPPRFTLRLTHDALRARVEIEDNGPGMSTEVCKRVFEPFFTTKEVGVGTGLGLSVSYFIITEHHNGTLSVESHLGQGTTFTILLPLAGTSDRDQTG